MRTIAELSEDIIHFNNSPDGLRKLKNHILHHWTVAEVVSFREAALPLLTNFHDGKEPGLYILFRDVSAFCYLNLGAACMLGVDPVAAEEMTPHALGVVIPQNRRAQDIKLQFARFQQSFDEMKKDVAGIGRGVKSAAHKGASEGAEKTIPKVYAKIASMTDDELKDHLRKKTRKPGGGRRQERDIGDAQVKAVLADMKKHKRESRLAFSAYVVRKGGDFVNPYTTAKGLDAAVRRYCKRHSVTPPFSTARMGRWAVTK